MISNPHSQMIISLTITICLCLGLAFPSVGSYSSFRSAARISEEEEEQLLGQFKTLALPSVTKEHMRTDGYLLRWLYAFDYDLERATKALRTSLEWRKANQIDGILSEDLSPIEKDVPIFMDGSMDPEGRPVIVFALGLCDVRKVVLAGPGQVEKYRRVFLRHFELAEALAYQQPGFLTRNVSKELKFPQFVVILDIGGFTIKQVACTACLPMIIKNIEILESNYPAGSYRAFAMNTPKIFATPFAIVKPFMSPITLNTLKIFGYDKNEWLKAMLEVIPADQLLTQYGGTKTILGNDSSRNADKNLWITITNETRKKVLLLQLQQLEDINKRQIIDVNHDPGHGPSELGSLLPEREMSTQKTSKEPPVNQITTLVHNRHHHHYNSAGQQQPNPRVNNNVGGEEDNGTSSANNDSHWKPGSDEVPAAAARICPLPILLLLQILFIFLQQNYVLGC